MICPWDVADPGQVPPEKDQFLLALHALLIGDQRGARTARSAPLEETLLLTGIDAAYARCARNRRAAARDAAARRAPGTRSQEEQTRADRRHAALADRAARAVQRLRRVRTHHRRADHRSPRGNADPVRHHRAAGPARPADDPGDRRPHRGTSPARPLTAAPSGPQRHAAGGQGKLFLVVEEGWALTASAAAGAWLNEYARRSRHYALWLIFVSPALPRPRHTIRAARCWQTRRSPSAFKTTREDLEHARAPLALTDTDIDQITTLPDPPRPLLEHLHDLHPRPRRRPVAARRPRVLDLLLRPGARPATPRRRAARDRRGPLGGAATALHPRVARTAAPRDQWIVMSALLAPAHAPQRRQSPNPRRRRGHSRWVGLAAGSAFMLVIAPVVLFARRRQPAVPDRARTRDRQHARRRRPGRRRHVCAAAAARARPLVSGRRDRVRRTRRPQLQRATARSAPPASPTSPRTPTRSPSSPCSTTTPPTAARSRSPTPTR